MTECSGGEIESGAYRVQQVELDVQAYQFHVPIDVEPPEGSEDGPKTKTLVLPSKELDGL